MPRRVWCSVLPVILPVFLPPKTARQPLPRRIVSRGPYRVHCNFALLLNLVVGTHEQGGRVPGGGGLEWRYAHQTECIVFCRPHSNGPGPLNALRNATRGPVYIAHGYPQHALRWSRTAHRQGDRVGRPGGKQIAAPGQGKAQYAGERQGDRRGRRCSRESAGGGFDEGRSRDQRETDA